RLARLHSSELHRASLDAETSFLPGHAGVARAGQVPGIGKVCTEMRAPRVFARCRRVADGFRHEYEALQVQPVVPRQVERQAGSVYAGRVELRFQLVECALRAPEARR